VKKTGDLPVPLHLRNAPTKLMKEAGYGKDYKYAHDYPGNFAFQEFMPEKASHENLYNTGDNAREKELKKKMSSFWKDKYNF